MHDLRVTRPVDLPDRFRIERCLRLPEFGPRILFFSGGNALRKTARELKRYTHNSTHVITSFDSGGSSAELRRAFRMPSIGDLRNRLLALADESVQGNPAIYRLFSHRMPLDESADQLEERFRALLRGDDPLVADLPSSMARLVRTHLRAFAEHARGTSFDLRGASIGNLVLSAGYLDNEKHLDSVLFLFSKLVGALGQVVPVTEEYAHLAADLGDRGQLVGQHLFRSAAGRIESISLVSSLNDPAPIQVSPNRKAIDALRDADLICFPMGSFFSSVVANLLPPGIAEAVTDCVCPRVYVPNTGVDPEQGGRSVADCLEVLLTTLGSRESASGHLEVGSEVSRAATREGLVSPAVASAPPNPTSTTEVHQPAPRDGESASAPLQPDRGEGGAPDRKSRSSETSRRGMPIDFVLLDQSDDSYEVPPERARITSMGVQLIELDLGVDSATRRIAAQPLVEALVSLA